MKTSQYVLANVQRGYGLLKDDAQQIIAMSAELLDGQASDGGDQDRQQGVLWAVNSFPGRIEL